MVAKGFEKVLTVIDARGFLCGVAPDTPKARNELRARGFGVSNGIATKQHADRKGGSR